MNTEELKRLAQAATPGPWAVNDDPRVNEGAPHLMTKDGYAIADFWGDESGLGLKGNERNAAYIAAANPTAILALIAEIARFTQDAEMAAASLSLLTGHHEHLLAEFDRVTKDRDELLAAWKEYQNADFGVSCQRGVVGKCMCAKCTNDRASAVFAKAEG